IAVEEAGPGIGEIAVPNLIGVVAQGDAFDFAMTGGIEKTQIDLFRVSGKNRKIHAAAIPCRPEGIILSWTDARRLHRRHFAHTANCGARMRPAKGGTVRLMEDGKPCEPTASVATKPALPIFPPP